MNVLDLSQINRLSPYKVWTDDGTPFIIKWDESGTDIENPVFMGVTIDATSHDATVEDVLTFTGTYAPVTTPADGQGPLHPRRQKGHSKVITHGRFAQN